jgi:hypothetical protein
LVPGGLRGDRATGRAVPDPEEAMMSAAQVGVVAVWALTAAEDPGRPRLDELRGFAVYAQRTRLCVDAKLGVPVKIEVHDRQGFLEKYQYTDIRPNQKVEPALFEGL